MQTPGRPSKQSERFASSLEPAAALTLERLLLDSLNPPALLSAFQRAWDVLPPHLSSSSLSALARLFGASDFLPRLLAVRPGLAQRLTSLHELGREKPLQRYVREASAAVRFVSPGAELELHQRLRRFKYRELVRLMAREVVLEAPPQEVGREHSALAEALIRAALEQVSLALCERYGAPDTPGFCVLGLGKLGGQDLNFSSDIDLVYLYEAEGRTAGGSGGSIASIQFFTKLAESLTRALSAPIVEGFCFRVDLNLRPQGRSGAIAISLPAMLAYYESRGRTWERAALVKARVVAGDPKLGEEVIGRLAPFVWRRNLDFSAIDEVRKLKNQINLRARASEDDLKLGPGGIREVEFFVAALQLLYGGKRPSLRETHTLRALRKIELEGLISSNDADALEEAYLFLRRAENRLQMVEERQVHRIPETDPERLRLARTLGFEDWSDFLPQLDRHRAFVKRAFDQLLGQAAHEQTPDEPMLVLALDPDAPEQERVDALEKRGFAASERALEVINRLSRVEGGPFALAPEGPQIPAVKWLSEIANTPDPDQALFHFSDFLGGLRSPASYLNLLGQVPQARRRLLNLFGQTDFLSRYFLRHPELLDMLVETGFKEPSKDAARIRAELSMRLGRGSDLEERQSAMRRFKNEEVLRIGLNDISGDLSVPQVASELTAVADAVLDEALFAAHAEQLTRYGQPWSRSATERLAVIAMGKLGGQELGYHSDLDLLFIYSGPGNEETSGGEKGRVSHREFFAKVAQRLLYFMQIQLREGYLYQVDARLRPSGNQGTLVVSEQAFRDHHLRLGQLWERQALIKARGVAGDLPWFEELRSKVLLELVYLRPLPADAATEIDRLRQRMAREISRETEEQLDPKAGYGGLVDVEFAVQYLQLVHGGQVPEVREPNTLRALFELQSARLVDPRDAEALRQGYLFHRRVENRLRLVHGYSLARLPTSGRPLAILARRLGYVGAHAGASFLADYREHSLNVHLAYDRILRKGG